MFLKPVEFNGMIQNANEVSHFKNQEDSRGKVQQNLMQNAMEVEHKIEQTKVHGDVKTETENLSDDGSSNAYYRKREKEKKEKKKKKHDEGKLIDKNKKKSFDIKI